MSFQASFDHLNWDDIHLSLYSKTARHVDVALAKPKRSLSDLMALLSPAAEPYLEQMAQMSQQLTRQRFGHTMGMFIPLYLSNLCSNVCTYCGFSMENRLKRKTLSVKEIEQECLAIKAMNFSQVLIVTGEHETKVGMDYFRQAIPVIKRYFDFVAMEVQPLDLEHYQELKQLGVDSVLVYQETYHRRTYAQHHLRGNKSDFDYRLQTADRLGQAGIDKIGLGALLGLQDWRTDLMFVGHHLDYLQRRYWQSRYSISLPRLRPCTGGIEVKSAMTDTQLVQALCAFRLFSPDLDLSLSTRESPWLRDHLVELGVTSMSAASKTQPGGYSNPAPELEQFSTSDERPVAMIEDMLIKQGITPVWKDWDRAYSF
ncbi:MULTISPECIES: 2-iminoacetate synthase ThiH [unclassified Vibrio]|uniref:2-iminoacetate synthase ThiH n=1 Tax=Vibrio sp. HB236076 TaxID=3232307 RepID=A0AB39HFN7_9VIBR|nr:2-iminoacetate synthase ThiH [Vibrio sp. HB161653]MDP5255824.1 2-iminoacetate synthase ThiH [Vibrio sp. HB161653]